MLAGILLHIIKLKTVYSVRNISEISLQLKYCRNIFVKYCKIYHHNITSSTLWNIFEGK